MENITLLAFQLKVEDCGIVRSENSDNGVHDLIIEYIKNEYKLRYVVIEDNDDMYVTEGTCERLEDLVFWGVENEILTRWFRFTTVLLGQPENVEADFFKFYDEREDDS